MINKIKKRRQGQRLEMLFLHPVQLINPGLLLLHFDLVVRQNRFRREIHLLQALACLPDHLARAADEGDGRRQIRQDVIEQ